MQDELKVDMDWRPPEDWLIHWELFVVTYLNSLVPNIVECICREESEHGWHFRIKLVQPAADLWVLRMQFLLGDDRVRCKLNYGRWRAGIRDWNKLWKCKVGRDNKK